MARAENTEFIDLFEEFYRDYYRNEIGELAQKYPNDQKSLFVDYQDLYRFDPDLAEDYRNKPEQLQEYAEEALRLFDLPIDVKLGQAHVRMTNLPESTDIREIRADHRGQLVSIQGIIRKATEVRPKITDAAFECQRCGTLTRIPQSTGDFQEPHECQGCERQGPFRINFDQSEFIDAQKLRVQESPEGLRGGETPQNIDVNIEDDITGNVTAGDHVRVTGVLKLDQRGNDREKSAMFDVYMNGVSVEIEDEEFEEMDIDEDDKKEIVALSEERDIYEQMTDSIAPSIYGYDQEKLAIALQLFSGVTKHLPDESRIRGDLHVLLIGDPGTGKCIKFDTNVRLADGTTKAIGELVEANLDDPKPVDDGVWDHASIPLPTLAPDGTLSTAEATKVWKREAPDHLYRIRTESGKELDVTPSHPLFVQQDGGPAAVEAEKLEEEQFVATPRSVPTAGDDRIEVDYRDVVPVSGDFLREIRDSLALSQSDCGVPREKYQHYECGDRNPSRESLRAVVDAFEERIAWLKDQRGGLAAEDWNTIVELRDELDISQQSIADGMDVTQTAVSYYERNKVAPDGGETVAASAVVRDRLDEALAVESTVDRLGDLATNDVRWDRIASIEMVEPDDEWVYDLEVEGTHSYVSNGVVSHNSQILQYIRHIAPRSVFTSGKGSSSAGLTAAAVRDDFGDGQQWTLEAGALVLADRGIAAVDELDKMRCVAGDTLVQADDGQRRIRELAIEAAEKGSIEDLSNGRTIRDVDLDVWTMTDDETLTQRPVTAIHEYDAPETLYEVILSTGEAVTVTPDHPFFIEQDSERVETPAEELQPGDQVYVPEGSAMATDGGTAQIDISTDSLPRGESRPDDIGLRTVEHVDAVPNHDYKSVYDLTVEGTHNFLANGMVVHNSEDRSAMHEALEQQSISISKAGINATLKSRCSLLGAANPKYGRFDQYEPIGEQIDLEPALISRFDLIFTVTDQPDEEEDAKLAEHILRTNYAGELNTHREQNSTPDYSAEEVDNVTDTVAPEIDPELLRKYVAYAKRSCFPTMTEEAKAAIRDFYVELRTKGSGEDAPVPVTARKLEALVRLAEASARVRLSDTVEEEDAERVIGIVRSSLEDIGIDPETGELDADVVETGTSKSQRDRIKNIRGIIADIEEEYDEGAPVDVVIERAEEVGMEASKAEHEIEKLKQQGEVYEPRTDHLRTT